MRTNPRNIHAKFEENPTKSEGGVGFLMICEKNPQNNEKLKFRKMGRYFCEE